MEIVSRRRDLLKGAGAMAAAATLAGPFGMLAARQAQAQVGIGASPYGPLFPTKDLATGLDLLQLPRGFKYRSMSWSGDMMANGQPVHPGHDGMGCFEVGSGRSRRLVLVRNHELRTVQSELDNQPVQLPIIDAPGKYDTATYKDTGLEIAGGNSNVEVFRGREVGTMPSLGGTIRNCAGGETPWGSWLSCEETLNFNDNGNTAHGFVFEVPADGPASGNAIREMGRFSHEAVAVDPFTGFVYESEDARNVAGFYKFEPANRSMRIGSLEQGGKLFMAKVEGQGQRLAADAGHGRQLQAGMGGDHRAGGGPDLNRSRPFRDRSHAERRHLRPVRRGLRQGRAAYEPRRGHVVQPCRRADLRRRHQRGPQQRRRSRPRRRARSGPYNPQTEVLTCIFVSQSAAAEANNPDNITVSPRGGILMCEDGGGVEDEFGFGERLVGLMPDGGTYALAKNNVVLDAAEHPAGGQVANLHSRRRLPRQGMVRRLFQPGRPHSCSPTSRRPASPFAISGPWARGNL